MSTPGTTRSGVGFRRCRVFALDANGYPAATSTTVYEGVLVEGAKALTLDDPEPRDIVHIGDDRVIQRDILPPDAPISGEIRTAKVNDALDAILSDNLSFSVGEAAMFAIASCNRGEENQVGILAYRQTLDTQRGSSDFGLRRWEGRIFPKVYLISRESGMEDSPEERPYSFRPLIVGSHLWGTAFDAAVEGATQAQGIRLVSEYKPKIVAWASDGVEVTYAFPTTNYPYSVAKTEDPWVDGVLQTESFTISTTNIVFSSAPSSGAIVVAFYEFEGGTC